MFIWQIIQLILQVIRYFFLHTYRKFWIVRCHLLYPFIRHNDDIITAVMSVLRKWFGADLPAGQCLSSVLKLHVIRKISGFLIHSLLHLKDIFIFPKSFRGISQHFSQMIVITQPHICIISAICIIIRTFTYLFLIRCSVFSAVLISKIPQMRIQPCINCVRMIFINTVHAQILYTCFFSDNIQLLGKIIFRILTVHLYIKWKFHL